MLPTVAQVLEMDAVRAGEPRVVAGEESLGRLVRWVHAIELPDAARLLRGGELVLTTGIALPGEEERVSNYVSELAGVGVGAVAGGVGRRCTGGLPEGWGAAAAGADPARLLEGFEARWGAVAPAARTAYDGPSGWLVTTVGARGEDWGRVILVCGGAPPGPGDVVLVERMATTFALGRLLTRQHQ